MLNAFCYFNFKQNFKIPIALYLQIMPKRIDQLDYSIFIRFLA